MLGVLRWSRKYRDLLAYLFFGLCTTGLNIIVYYLCAHPLGMGTLVSTVAAWILSVLFAYITNKLFVFRSLSFSPAVLGRELMSFFSCRLATGLLDLAVMFVFVDKLHLWDLPVKIASNILVIVLNYAASKIWIFKKGSRQKS